MKRKKTDMVKSFEFALKINNHIICQRFFGIKDYNNECRESYELKELMDELMNGNPASTLGIIPEFFKYKCMENSYKPYDTETSTLYNKNDEFTLEIYKNNVNKLRDKNGDFDIDDLEKTVIVSGTFDGNIFHQNVRYEIDIRGIIPDIINTISKYLSQKEYTKYYGDVKLTRHNKLTPEDLEKIKEY